MALQCVCDKGHVYIQADVCYDWPDDAPACPECHVGLLELQVSKGKVRMAGNETGIQVYADEDGIGIFPEGQEGWGDDWGTLCADLRIDDKETFLKFMREMAVLGANKGWLPAVMWL